jgi:hypothetical protein
MVLEAFSLKREKILFAAFAGCDAAGARLRTIVIRLLFQRITRTRFLTSPKGLDLAIGRLFKS